MKPDQTAADLAELDAERIGEATLRDYGICPRCGSDYNEYEGYCTACDYQDA